MKYGTGHYADCKCSSPQPETCETEINFGERVILCRICYGILYRKTQHDTVQLAPPLTDGGLLQRD